MLLLRRICFRCWCGVAFLTLASCQSETLVPPKEPAAAAESRTSVALRVLVMNDQPLAEAIERLRGEWREQSGGELTATSKPWAEVAAAEAIDADMIVFPTRYMGELCVRRQLRPVRKSVLEDKAVDLADVFPLVRLRLISWGGQAMALPLGVDFANGSGPPDRRPGLRLLIVAAPQAVSPNRMGDLFDPESMKPRLTEPAFADALVQLSKSDAADNAKANASRVPVLGVGDRLAAVTSSSRNAASAFKLLAWLATPDVSSQLAGAGDGTMPVRRSLASSPTWYDAKLNASERTDLGKTLGSALSGNECLIVPRIPGVDEYMAALDQAVTDVAVDKVEPAEALKKASAQWEKITDARGRESQRQAYLKHLGIIEP
jgi:hypothetical protein